MTQFELKKDFPLPNGEVVIIGIDEDAPSIIVTSQGGKHIGNIDLVDIDEGHCITWMYLDLAGDQYKRQGIGTAALEYFIETGGGPLYAAQNDGLTRSDGSHLTQDAPGFIGGMRIKGIVSRN